MSERQKPDLWPYIPESVSAKDYWHAVDSLSVFIKRVDSIVGSPSEQYAQEFWDLMDNLHTIVKAKGTATAHELPHGILHGRKLEVDGITLSIKESNRPTSNLRGIEYSKSVEISEEPSSKNPLNGLYYSTGNKQVPIGQIERGAIPFPLLTLDPSHRKDLTGYLVYVAKALLPVASARQPIPKAFTDL